MTTTIKRLQPLAPMADSIPLEARKKQRGWLGAGSTGWPIQHRVAHCTFTNTNRWDWGWNKIVNTLEFIDYVGILAERSILPSLNKKMTVSKSRFPILSHWIWETDYSGTVYRSTVHKSSLWYNLTCLSTAILAFCIPPGCFGNAHDGCLVILRQTWRVLASIACWFIRRFSIFCCWKIVQKCKSAWEMFEWL